MTVRLWPFRVWLHVGVTPLGLGCFIATAQWRGRWHTGTLRLW